jgi:hypothetical protein
MEYSPISEQHHQRNWEINLVIRVRFQRTVFHLSVLTSLGASAASATRRGVAVNLFSPVHLANQSGAVQSDSIYKTIVL